MNHESRTYKSLQNSIIALSFYFVNLVLQFFFRQIFIQKLGSEILGLNTTTTSLLQFLNLAEMGIGSAVACTLFKPLRENDHTAINEIVSLQGWLYRKIAFFIIGGSIVLLCFFPLIFKKTDLPLWYAYASYLVMLFSSLLGYFVNYKQIVLSANQQEYKVRLSYNSSMMIKIIVQIFALSHFPHGYIWWIALEAIFAIVAAKTLNIAVKKSAPYLKTDNKAGALYKQKYPDVITKVKQMFFHKASRYALTQLSPIIIYTYATLSTVAIYGNYMLIVTGLTALLDAIFHSITAGVGNMVAEGNKQRILSVFRELFSSRFWIVSSITFCLYHLANSFISLWVGSEYIIDGASLSLIVLIFFLNTSRTVVDNFISAYGLFKDIAAPVIEASINIGLSLLLGYYFGLPGILGGVAISLVLVVHIWKPYFLFKNALHYPLKFYVLLYAKHLMALIVSFVFCSFVLHLKILHFGSGIPAFIFQGLYTFLLFGTVEFVILYACEKGMRDFILRIIAIFKKRI